MGNEKTVADKKTDKVVMKGEKMKKVVPMKRNVARNNKTDKVKKEKKNEIRKKKKVEIKSGQDTKIDLKMKQNGSKLKGLNVEKKKLDNSMKTKKSSSPRKVTKKAKEVSGKDKKKAVQSGLKVGKTQRKTKTKPQTVITIDEDIFKWNKKGSSAQKNPAIKSSDSKSMKAGKARKVRSKKSNMFGRGGKKTKPRNTYELLGRKKHVKQGKTSQKSNKSSVLKVSTKLFGKDPKNKRGKTNKYELLGRKNTSSASGSGSQLKGKTKNGSYLFGKSPRKQGTLKKKIRYVLLGQKKSSRLSSAKNSPVSSSGSQLKGKTKKGSDLFGKSPRKQGPLKKNRYVLLGQKKQKQKKSSRSSTARTPESMRSSENIFQEVMTKNEEPSTFGTTVDKDTEDRHVTAHIQITKDPGEDREEDKLYVELGIVVDPEDDPMKVDVLAVVENDEMDVSAHASKERGEGEANIKAEIQQAEVHDADQVHLDVHQEETDIGVMELEAHD